MKTASRAKERPLWLHKLVSLFLIRASSNFALFTHTPHCLRLQICAAELCTSRVFTWLMGFILVLVPLILGIKTSKIWRCKKCYLRCHQWARSTFQWPYRGLSCPTNSRAR